MHHYTAALIALALGAVRAQTPAGWLFSPNVTQELNLTFANTDEINPVGKQIPRQDTVNPPIVTVNQTVFNSTSTGILFMIDSDVPINGTRMPLLHWLVPGVTNPNGTLNLPMPSSDPNVEPKVNGTPYLQPNPPAGDSAHRYTFLLYLQPSGFVFPAKYSSVSPPQMTSQRIGFNLTDFLSSASIPNQPIAANYVQVQNNTAVPTTSYPPLSTAMATSTAHSSSKAGANSLSGGAGSFAAGILGLVAIIV